MNIAMKRKERIAKSKIEAMTTKLSNQKYLTQQLAKEVWFSCMMEDISYGKL